MNIIFQPLKRSFYQGLLITAVFLGGFVETSRSADAPFYLKDGDKVVFYGDSITEQRLYTNFTEVFVLTRFPNLKVDFTHSGWGGDRVGGGGGGPIDKRLERDVFAYQPTVVTIMLGMNDGGYHAADAKTTETYEKGYQYILDQLKSKIPNVRLTLILPSAYDDVTRPPTFPDGYNSVLKGYSQFLKDVAVKGGDTTADFNAPMVEVLTKANQLDPALATQIIPDRVHPSPGGHLIMAEALLKAWNAPGLVSDVAVDVAGQKFSRTEKSKTGDLKVGETISWTQTDESLPMPIDLTEREGSTPVIALALKSSDFTQALNREMLSVAGLPKPFYKMTIDGSEVGVFSREDLAKGINLAEHATPMMTQAKEVKQLTFEHNDKHAMRWRSIQVPLLDLNKPELKDSITAILAALDSEEKASVEKQRAKAQPVLHHYELTPQDAAEAEISTVIPPPPVMPAGLGTNVALNKKFVSSNPNPGWDSGATDGSWAEAQGTTYASGNSPDYPKTLTIDLEKPESLTNVLVGVPVFGGTKKVALSVSSDNEKFTEVGNYLFPQRASVKHLFTFPAVEARYLRLTFPNQYDTTDYGPNYVFVSEVEAYGPAKK